MTPDERINAAALVLLAKKLSVEYHRGRHEGINDRRLDVLNKRVDETWHTFIPYAVRPAQLARSNSSEALAWLAKALCSEYYRGWHEGVGDRRDEVYKKKIEDYWNRWSTSAKDILMEAFPHLDGKLN